MREIRLQKILAQAGLASRREAERLILAGRVSVNGKVVRELGTKADPARDAIKFGGKLIARREAPIYLVMNKPKNVLTTMRDEEGKNRPTVAELLPPRGRRVFPVGRLDFDAEGLLLLTNDGDLAHRLTHPRYEIPRVYEVKIKGKPSERALRRLDRMAGGKEDAPPEARRVRLMGRKAERNTWIQIELREGKHHQIKNMCEAAGHQVLKLLRRSFAGISTRGIPRPGLRPLTEEEITRLRLATNLIETPPKKRKTPKHKTSKHKAPKRKTPKHKTPPRKRRVRRPGK